MDKKINYRYMDELKDEKKKLKTGDKVRFLNSVGGGIVTTFRGKEMVLVEDEDGFEIPVLISECVVVGEVDIQKDKKNILAPQTITSTNSSSFPRRQGSPNSPSLSSPSFPRRRESPSFEVQKPVVEPFVETPQGERLNLSLAFLPVEPQSFIKTPFEAYLINESNYYLYFNYMSCMNNSWTSRFHGLIEPDTKIFMEEFEKIAINEIEHICLQMIAFKERKTFSLKNALTVELRLDTVKFYKLHCFTKNSYFDDDALIVPVVINDVPERQMLVSASDLQEAMYRREKEERRKPQPAIVKHEKADNKIEVDLHINQLLETTTGMSHADILNCQLSKFHEVMKAHSTKKGQRIVFIHGKGEGVLRAAMEKELKTTYKKLCRFQDASFHEYGFGATMVIIH